jgi:uncharacterized protein YkwD
VAPPLSRVLIISLGLLLLPACVRSESNPVSGAPGSEAGPKLSRQAPLDDLEAAADEEPPPSAELLEWQQQTRSPRASTDDAHAALGKLCDGRDGALDAVAARLAKRTLANQPPLPPTEIHFSLRAEGSPYVWVRAWSLDGQKLVDGDVRERAKRWLGSFDDGGQRRCGFAKQTSGGREVMYAVAADVIAELDPLPTQTRTGQWLKVSAKMLVPASEAKVVVLGPRGAPKPVPTSLTGNTVKATFSADAPGTWMVQVLATVDGGPRPVAEAIVSVDAPPPRTLDSRSVPGEQAMEGKSDDADAMFAMLNGARRSEQSRVLTRDPRLDKIAEEHAQAMQTARRLGHDVGAGSAADRMRAQNLVFTMAGENVARAASIRRAHRALWASPSHRGNLLDPRFQATGVGVAKDPDGSVWVCEVFATWR